VIALIAILLATLNVNIGANVVSPANDFSNLRPRLISFKTGGVITCFMGLAMMPWKLLASYQTFILGWLGGYAAFLGPVAGIMICDYFGNNILAESNDLRQYVIASGIPVVY